MTALRLSCLGLLLAGLATGATNEQGGREFGGVTVVPTQVGSVTNKVARKASCPALVLHWA